jgi:hypothetical protein
VKPEPLPPPTAELPREILGSWRLASREDYDAEGRRHIDPILGGDPLGFLTFAPGAFAAQFMKRDRGASTAVQATAVQATAAGANNTGAVDGYDAYFGRYSVDAKEGVITTTIEGSISPANIGLTLRRDIRAAGNRLWIRLATTAADGTPVTRTLTFERVV